MAFRASKAVEALDLRGEPDVHEGRRIQNSAKAVLKHRCRERCEQTSEEHSGATNV